MWSTFLLAFMAQTLAGFDRPDESDPATFTVLRTVRPKITR